MTLQCYTEQQRINENNAMRPPAIYRVITLFLIQRKCKKLRVKDI